MESGNQGQETGRSVHVGGPESYVALFSHGDGAERREDSYHTNGGLNHFAVVVEDFEETRGRVIAAGLTPGEVHDHEPGRRFYFREPNGIAIEVVSYG